jgi:adenosylcobinamide-GDP ribazoletransferase
MALAPLVGLLLGVVLGAAALGLRLGGASALVAAAATVALSALGTRALHLDGLADTADGLGSYKGADKALEIMKKSDIGPFGVVAIVAVLLLDAGALTSLLARPWLEALTLVATGAAAGRLGAVVACRKGLPAARPDGLGALVAETLPVAAVTGITLLVAAAAALADPVRGPVAVLSAAGIAWALTRHAQRRLGGVTGDVMGAAIELGTMSAWLVLSTTP